MNVRGLFAVVLSIVLTPVGLSAQRVEITPFGGFQFGGNLRVQSGDLSVSSGLNYGFTFDISFAPGGKIEFLYSRQKTDLKLEDEATGAVSTLFDMAIEFIHVGAVYEWDLDKIKPFVVLTGGVTRMVPQGIDRESGRWASGIFGGGAKTFISEHVGVKAQGRLVFSLVRAGDELFCAPAIAGGCLVGLQRKLMAQGMLTGGVFVAF
jgi:hypothetical protein